MLSYQLARRLLTLKGKIYMRVLAGNATVLLPVEKRAVIDYLNKLPPSQSSPWIIKGEHSEFGPGSPAMGIILE